MTMILGGDPFERYIEGPLKGLHKNKIISVFPTLDIIATGTTTHLDSTARLIGVVPWVSKNEQTAMRQLMELYVGAYAVDGRILFNCDNYTMEQVKTAAEAVEDAFPLREGIIRYKVSEPDKLEDIRRLGELYRVSPHAYTPEEMLAAIEESRVQLSEETGVIYHYNFQNPRNLGTRYLTQTNTLRCMTFPKERRRKCAEEIAKYSRMTNRRGSPEVKMFNADFMPEGDLRQIVKDFEKHRIDHSIAREHSEMFQTALYMALNKEMEREEQRLGLCDEMQLRIAWERGGSFDENGQFKFHRRTEDHVRGILTRIIEVDSGLDDGIRWINTGLIVKPNATRKPNFGRREVRLVEIGREKGPDVRIVRRQQMDTADYLDEGVEEGPGKGYARGMPDNDALFLADRQAEQYSNYQDLCRRQAVRIGMHALLPQKFHIYETYRGRRASLNNMPIRAFYTIRPYCWNKATDKISVETLRNDDDFATAAICLLGHGAAYNFVVRRGDVANGVLYNDGDECFDEYREGLPTELKVNDPTGCFELCWTPLPALLKLLDDKVRSYTSVKPQGRDLFWGAFLNSYARIRQRVIDDISGGGERMRQLFVVKQGDNVDTYRLSQHPGPGTPRDRNEIVIRSVQDNPVEKIADMISYVRLDRILDERGRTVRMGIWAQAHP